jgi:hypothetical protein
MTNQSAVSEKIGLDDPQSPIHKESFDEEEGTIHPCGEDFKEDFKAATNTPPVQQPEVLEDEYPDGGLRAWLVVFGVHVSKWYGSPCC